MRSIWVWRMLSELDAFGRLIWNGSLLLAAAALLLACLLALKRWFEERARTRLAARQKDVSRLVHALLGAPSEPESFSIPPLQPGDEPALFNVALDILRVTRGRDAARMLALVRMWNLRPFVRKVLSSRNRNRKIRALTLLAHEDDAESLELLLGQIGDSSVYVQLAAVRAIADRGDARHLDAVVAALARARATNVPLLADTLRRFGEPAVPAIAELARAADTLEIRFAAVTALGHIGSLTAFATLIALMDDAEPAIRRRALHALAQLGDPRAEGVIRHALVDADARVRAAAAQAAGLLGLRGMLSALMDALGDEVWEVRYRAAESLYHLGAPGVAALRAVAAEPRGTTAALGEGEDGADSTVRPDVAADMVSEKPSPDRASDRAAATAVAMAAEMAAEMLSEKTGAFP